MTDYIEDLKGVVSRLHECEATHLETVPVKEEFLGAVVWAGEVEVFALRGHPKAARCYAWSYPEGRETRYVTMLKLPPVEDPRAAVRAAIAGGGA